nr:unnamed protein product [Callosobruchus chinensis]
MPTKGVSTAELAAQFGISQHRNNENQAGIKLLQKNNLPLPSQEWDPQKITSSEANAQYRTGGGGCSSVRRTLTGTGVM